ncbi:MAG: UDP-N-acetylmuramoyl-L-alanine--D-glutamate ligase, partial [Acidobacteria bacterium]|nr:UDP-N-acetylmuramoyl-L-alanine--D-glutamate ligase [Acidobacteriota bacterium]
MSALQQSLSAQNPWSSAGWRRVLVYGLGLSGRAAASLLLRSGVEVVAVDRRQEGEVDLGPLAGAARFEALLGREPEVLPPGLDGVVVSPGVPPDRPLLRVARAAGLPVISEVELAFPLLRGPVVGITGTNGKSTTTELTGAMLAASGRAVEVCGNIGRPLSDRVEGPDGRLFVVELSSFQLENLVTFHPRAAALLNLAEDHLDRYPSFAEYAAAKLEIFRNQGPQDQAILNGDDGDVRRLTGGLKARRRFFSRAGKVADGCHLEEEQVIEVAPGRAPLELFHRRDLRLEGAHNLENAMAAALLARALGAAPADLRRALETFRGLPHRMVRVRLVRGVTYFDDSKGTN